METRRKRKGTSRRNIEEIRQISEWRCGVCDQLYEDETEEEEVWIECSQCQLWYHVDCVNLALRDLPDDFFVLLVKFHRQTSSGFVMSIFCMHSISY